MIKMAMGLWVLCIDIVFTIRYYDGTYLKSKQKMWQDKQYIIRFDPEKEKQLQEVRQVSFLEIIRLLKHQAIIADIKHYSQRYPHQRLLIVELKGYIWAVPYVIDKKKKEIWLKTVFPSRKLKKEFRHVKKK